ncbi:unnamed protein product [Haemonchus placei]|uniref:HELICc2 domain-containing protein n=1 Tax=Haemonchus placei TaxID=6290 RepID=A0A0N4W578_HAEPC|nr:unnamed protein product [Haemonchus placei]
MELPRTVTEAIAYRKPKRNPFTISFCMQGHRQIVQASLFHLAALSEDPRIETDIFIVAPFRERQIDYMVFTCQWKGTDKERTYYSRLGADGAFISYGKAKLEYGRLAAACLLLAGDVQVGGHDYPDQDAITVTMAGSQNKPNFDKIPLLVAHPKWTPTTHLRAVYRSRRNDATQLRMDGEKPIERAERERGCRWEFEHGNAPRTVEGPSFTTTTLSDSMLFDS